LTESATDTHRQTDRHTYTGTLIVCPCTALDRQRSSNSYNTTLHTEYSTRCQWCQWQWQHGSATGELGHYGSHPRSQVADRGTPLRMDKRVAPDKEGAADKQCLRKRKTLISNQGRWSSLSLFRQIHLGEGKL